MLSFLRRHQKLFFVAITVVLVISFSFFGTYKTYMRGEKKEKDSDAFIAIDKQTIRQSEYQDLIRLLNVDAFDSATKEIPGGALNDGFITKNILEPGIFPIIVAPHMQTVFQEMEGKFAREAHFTPYTNRYATFISADQVWSSFAPHLRNAFHEFQGMPVDNAQKFLEAKINLYLAERTFPAPYLRYFLQAQEKQYPWIQPDQDQLYKNLWLFGYTTFQDWFGRKALGLIAQYVINVAKIAEKKGYDVSEQSVRASIIENLHKGFEMKRHNPNFRIPNESVYFEHELRGLGMDFSRLEQAWRYVMLYRAYMQTAANSAVIPFDIYKRFFVYLNEFADLEAYCTPKALAFKTIEDVEKFEIYIDAIRDPKEKVNDLLLPQKMATISQVKMVCPELVAKRYRLKYSHVSRDALAATIGVKKTWEWQVDDKNWKTLQDEFAALKTVDAPDAEGRYTALNALDPKTRSQIDIFSRTKIVESHPEWIEEALVNAHPKEDEVLLRERSSELPMAGISNTIEFMRLLDAIPLNVENPTLKAYSQDGMNYYTIQVLDRDEARILTFKDANLDGTLDALLTKALEIEYDKIKVTRADAKFKENGNFKPLDEVRNEVAEIHFSTLFRRLDDEAVRLRQQNPTYCSWDNKDQARTACRLYPYVRQVRDTLEQHPENSGMYLVDAENDNLADQFKLIHTRQRVLRKESAASVNVRDLFQVASGKLSPISYLNQGTLSFFKVIERGAGSYGSEARKKVYAAKDALGYEVERSSAKMLVDQMVKKGAFSLVKDER